MEKFATNKNGNIDSGTEVLANNMVFLQQAKADAISNLYGDLFNEGILNINMGTTINPIEPFQLKEGTIAGAFSIGIGIAYKKDVNTGLNERIAILEETDYHNEPFEDTTYPDGRGVNQKTFDGVDSYVDTPKSSGCLNIPITSTGVTYYVDLRYVSVCDNGNLGDGLNLINYSIAKNLDPNSSDQRKRFYKWIDGYNVVLITDLAQQQGIILGTVEKDVSNNLTFTSTGKTNDLLIKSNAFMDYFADGSGISIVDYGEEKRLSVNVDNVTTEIEDNKVRVTEDALYPYTKFSVNSGFIDSNNNEPNILGTNGTDIALSFGIGNQVPIVVSPAYNRQYTILPTDNYDFVDDAGVVIQNYYGEIADGIYTICINDTDKDNDNVKLEKPKLEIMKKVYISETVPTALKGNIWVDTSIEPFRAKWYNGFEWLEYHGVPLGDATINGTTVNSVISYDFNVQIENRIKTNNLSIYNFANDAVKNYIELKLNDVGNLRIANSTGIYFPDTNVTLSVPSSNTLNIGATTLTINGNPIPRLPDYASGYSIGSGQSSFSIPSDGWILATQSAGPSELKINNYVIWDTTSWNTTNTETKELFLPVKTGDIIYRDYVAIIFFPYR